MSGRLALFGALLATLPFAVDLPADSSRSGGTQVELAGGGGQFAIVSRGCDGNAYRITRNQLASGALVVEQPLPRQFVIGVRAGDTRTTLNDKVLFYHAPEWLGRDSAATTRYSNPYVNPYVGWESRGFGVGAGAIMADHPLIMGEGGSFRPHTTWHARVSNGGRSVSLRWLEDVPLESEGHLSVELEGQPIGRVEAAAFAGLFGPYDGAMLGLRGRVWITPDAAAQIKAGTTGRDGEYGVYGSLIARLPGPR